MLNEFDQNGAQLIEIPWANMHTFLIEMQVNGRKLARGTCIAVSRNGQSFILTNRHNVTGRDQYTNKCLSRTGGVPDHLVVCLPTQNLGNYWWCHGVPLYDASGNQLWIEHPLHGANIDVVALPFDPPPQAKCFFVLLDDIDNFSVTVGDAVHAVGYRGGNPLFSMFPQWIECTIQTQLSFQWNRLPAFLINGATAEGCSGSPVIAHREDATKLTRSDGSLIATSWASRILGIYSGRSTTEDLGVVWNLECMREIIDHASYSFAP